jgi:hypothetical protein
LVAAAAAAALALRGQRYVLAAVPPTAGRARPRAADRARRGVAATPWVAIAVALATGLSAALVKPTVPLAARHLRVTALVVCALTGAAGIAGSLATPGATLATLGIITATALATALLGRDPAARRVAWLVPPSARSPCPPPSSGPPTGSCRPARSASSRSPPVWSGSPGS